MNKIVSVRQISSSVIKSDKNLAISISTKDVDRKKSLIKQYGLISLPVVSEDLEGSFSLIKGESDLWAIRELGIDYTDVVVVDSKDQSEIAKLKLILCTLKNDNTALVEGMILQQLLSSKKFSQRDLALIVGKSVSWISKRLNLVTRLNKSVCNMVKQKLIPPQIAQEIAKLPEEVQYDFAVNVIKDGISKSKVEKLVNKHNSKNCTKTEKDMIIHKPIKAEQMLKEKVSQKDSINEGDNNKEMSPLITKLNSLITLSSQTQGLIEVLDQKQLLSTQLLACTTQEYLLKLSSVIKKRYVHPIQPHFSPGKISILLKKEGDEIANR